MSLLATADTLLRGQTGRRLAWPTMVLVIVCFAPIYGGAMGAYGLVRPERLLQVCFSAMKAPLLLLVTTGLCLPGFFVVSTVVGVRDDFGPSVRAILRGQAAMSLILASLAPVIGFVYVSGVGYANALLLNGLLFAIGAGAAQMVMRLDYAALVRKRRRHRALFWAWLVMYSFVGVQMGWTLRPFIGAPERSPTFLRDGAWTNAYVELAAIARRAAGATSAAPRGPGG